MIAEQLPRSKGKFEPKDAQSASIGKESIPIPATNLVLADIVQFKCSVCHKEFKDLRAYNQHIRDAHHLPPTLLP